MLCTTNCIIFIRYSGDCMPCDGIVKLGIIAGENIKDNYKTLLIHEATFDDDMLEMANKKKHSTITGALKIASKINADYVLLTHTSQRTPHFSINNLQLAKWRRSSPDSSKMPLVIPAFDFMSLNLSDFTKFQKYWDCFPQIKDAICETTKFKMDDEKKNILEVLL